MTDKETINQIGMAHGADAANDAAGQGSGVPMDYLEAMDAADHLYDHYENQVYHKKCDQIVVTDEEVLEAMDGTDRVKYNLCNAVIKAFKDNPNI